MRKKAEADWSGLRGDALGPAGVVTGGAALLAFLASSALTGSKGAGALTALLTLPLVWQNRNRVVPALGGFGRKLVGLGDDYTRQREQRASDQWRNAYEMSRRKLEQPEALPEESWLKPWTWRNDERNAAAMGRWRSGQLAENERGKDVATSLFPDAREARDWRDKSIRGDSGRTTSAPGAWTAYPDNG